MIGNLTFPIRHAGQYYDQEVNIFYNYFRDYDPITGRYVESDPIGLAGGLNTYAYVGNNPIGFVDPEGLVSQGNHKLDLDQVKRIKEQLKDPTIDKKTRNELKAKLKRHEKAVGERSSRISKDKFLKNSFLLPLILACDADPCNPICQSAGLGDACQFKDKLIACQN